MTGRERPSGRDWWLHLCHYPSLKKHHLSETRAHRARSFKGLRAQGDPAPSCLPLASATCSQSPEQFAPDLKQNTPARGGGPSSRAPVRVRLAGRRMWMSRSPVTKLPLRAPCPHPPPPQDDCRHHLFYCLKGDLLLPHQWAHLSHRPCFSPLQMPLSLPQRAGPPSSTWRVRGPQTHSNSFSRKLSG